jgi:hypothetical protein
MATARTLSEPPATACKHHWVLGQPDAGQIRAVCKLCGSERFYPAVLDDLDPGVDPEASFKQSPFAGPGMGQGVATAVGGVRPSSVAFSGSQDEAAAANGAALLGDSES